MQTFHAITGNGAPLEYFIMPPGDSVIINIIKLINMSFNLPSLHLSDISLQALSLHYFKRGNMVGTHDNFFQLSFFSRPILKQFSSR